MSTTSKRQPYLPGTTLAMLTGQRVCVRPFTFEDVTRRCRWPRYVEPEFSHLNVDLNSEARRSMWYRQRSQQRSPFWFAVDTVDGKMIGELTLREVDQGRKTARLGIHLSSAYIGSGYGTDAVRVVLDYTFDRLHFKEMKLDVAAHNRRAIRCYEKLGFSVAGSFWRMHPWSFQVLTDPRCVHLRPYVRLDGGLEVMKHWEMSLPTQDWRRGPVPDENAKTPPIGGE